MFEYDFILRALTAGIAISICASLLGVSLVLKRYSMIGDGLSHVGFGALCFAAALNAAPLVFALPTVCLCAFLLFRLTQRGKIKGDSAIALISSTALAVGVIVTSLTNGANVDVFNFMFGSILSVSEEETLISLIISGCVIAVFVLCYNKIFAITADEGFAKASGINTSFYNTLIALLCSLTIVIGMKLMGALLISALIVFPALSCMRVFKRYKWVVVSSCILGVIAFVCGVVLSYELSLPTGASIVCVNALIFLLFFIAGRVKTNLGN